MHYQFTPNRRGNRPITLSKQAAFTTGAICPVTGSGTRAHGAPVSGFSGSTEKRRTISPVYTEKEAVNTVEHIHAQTVTN
jgi:hypothetical protein